MIKFLLDIGRLGRYLIGVFGPVIALAFLLHWDSATDVLFAWLVLIGFALEGVALVFLWVIRKAAVSRS